VDVVAKKHIHFVSGCSLSTLEGHLAEIMWSNHVGCNNGNEYEELLALLKWTAVLLARWSVQAGKLCEFVQNMEHRWRRN